MKIQKATLFLCLIVLCLDVCLGQNDCTGVDCPVLENCIKTVLEEGACCPTCTERGCTCEGYQYYDCAQANFRDGKVPEGESYFVDFGSTVCSCPLGGGRISCHFIPCPEIPPNCITILQPQDGCAECEQVGCVNGNKKYKAGLSFHVKPCQVCHCPNKGGRLMCLPIPGCKIRGVNNPMLVTTTENNNPLRDTGSRPTSRQSSSAESFSKLALGNTLPLYKHDPPSFGTADYESTPSPTIRNLAPLLESTTVPSAYPESSSTTSSSHDDRRHWPQSPNLERSHEVEVTHDLDPTTTEAQNKTSTSLTTTTTQRAATDDLRPKLETGEQTTTQNNDRNRAAQETSKNSTHTVRSNQRGRNKHSPSSRGRNHGSSHSVSYKGQEKVSGQQRWTLGKEQQGLFPKVQFSPTSRTPVRMSEEETELERQPQTLHNYLPEEVKEETEVSAKELVKTCCETGKKWASANSRCNNMMLPARDRHSLCWTAQQQCCLGSLGESRCSDGVSAARAGILCEREEKAFNECGTNSFKDCCGCCSLGLQFASEGHHCETPQYLGFHCRHIFLTCCGGNEEGTLNQDGWPTVREKPALDSTPPPEKVSDNSYPKEAFSNDGEEQDGQNTVDGPDNVEDMDECAIYEGNICHHKCVNTHGSFRCECFPGYVLQEDALTCAQETVDEENRLKEADRASAADPTPQLPPPTKHLAPLNPCEGNTTCEQQCTPVDGNPQCSCFPGFTLRADGRSCEDINECVEGSHSCSVDFDCVNSNGSFRCDPKPRCPAGYNRNAQCNCVDIDECGGVTQPCGAGFNCVNTVGSYMCHRKIICHHGYHSSPNGSSCIDVDECQTGLHQCGEGQLCQNLPGSYRCECQSGYQYDSFRRMCVDVNECWRYPGQLCAQTCENTPGSYQCSCTAGFRLYGDGKSCKDINECLASPCSQECANIYGSYQCYCRQGYYLKEDGHTCEDIDECSQSIGHLCTYKCVNVPGSYQCACPEYGYTVSPNGRSCRDIDECATGAHNCTLPETCYNIQGGYRCLSLSCPPNYRKVSNTRCERISCLNSLDCQNSPVRVTYYYLSFQSNIVIPAEIFRIGASPAYAGDDVIVTITEGNEDNYFSTRKLNAYMGAVYLHRQVEGSRDLLVTVEMKLWRQGRFTTFQAKLYIFITGSPL